MQLDIDFDSIEQIVFNAWDQGRDFLFEYEVYALLAKSGWWTRIQIRFALPYAGCYRRCLKIMQPAWSGPRKVKPPPPAIPPGCQKAQV